MRSLTINLSLAVAATFGLSAFAGVARAADMPVEYPPIIEAPEPMPLAAVGGWYLRGDIGYKLYEKPKGSIGNTRWGGYDDGNDNGGVPDTWPYTTGGHDQMINEKMLGALDIGVGAGYKFNDYLRADVVLDYETPAKFKGSIWCQDAGTCATGAYIGSESVKIEAYSALANVYADLGNFHGVIPYIGGGIGASYLRTSDVQSAAKGLDGNSPKGDGKWNFAWALMAGVEYPISDRLSVDLGYRYLNLGDAQTASVTDAQGVSSRMKYEDITAHEVRVGLRYYLN
ncbi:outer membrane protein [Pleomorphomonas sp. NRK KF1]|uniref:outer membrane protein n=1 Tax=Pleomorphomonas sp. NRK KF1 TaxID=2943000 RepID=UPI00204302C8|nr:outer membrane protein [Pleomorphomonas sp. NRK KF1]MCM5554971.1 porin family protein [Pleomorphomonas sp. NRK KF1]